MNINYRPEIDGLRTIAVLSVIIYHAEFTLLGTKLLPGGFLGVDIFFVISGFLISSIIIRELQSTGRFSFADFYERRARRILPALFVVIFFSIPFAWWLLLPEQIIDFAKSILSSISFISNIYWLSSLQEYGAESASLKPLLHTWSLAVEEQFYILFPFVLLFLFKRNHKHAITLLLAILFGSLLFAEAMSKVNESFSFYMLSSRLWELLAGGLLAWILSFYSPSVPNLLKLIMPMVGAYLIAYGILFVSFEESNHPGFITLLVVLGTTLIIWFAEPEEPLTRLLSNRLFVAIGLISYSLYLWHYPIFAFGRALSLDINIIDKLVWILLTFILAIISYFVVEKPCRSKQKVSRFTFSISLLSVAILLTGISLYIIKFAGFQEGVNSLVNETLNPSEEFQNLQSDKINSTLNGKAQLTPLYLLGDSHLERLEAPLEKMLGTKYNLQSLSIPHCQYILNMNRVNKKNNRSAFNSCDVDVQRKRREILLSGNIGIVILGGRLPALLSESPFDNGEGGKVGDVLAYMQYPDRFLKTIKERQKAIFKEYTASVKELIDYGHKVVLIYPVPEVGWHVPKRISQLTRGLEDDSVKQFLLKNPVTTSYAAYQARAKDSFELLDSITGVNVIRIYPHELLCNKQIRDRCVTHIGNKTLYSDDNHLSGRGFKLLSDKIVELLDRAGGPTV